MGETPERISRTELFGLFFRVGSLAFGGGAATLAMLHDEFCSRRAVVRDDEFQLFFGLSRLVPGMNLLSLTVLLGYHTHGAVGSLLALAGLTGPSFTLIVLGCMLLRDGRSAAPLAGAVRALGPAATALLLHTGAQICLGSLRPQAARGRLAWSGLLLLAAVLALLTPLHPAWLVLGSAALGAALAGRLREKPTGEESA